MTEKMYVYINGTKTELEGLELKKFLEQRQVDNAELQAQAIKAEAKKAARESALTKLAALGLTEEEIGAL